MSFDTCQFARGVIAAIVVSVLLAGCHSGPRILRPRHDDTCYEPGSDEWWAAQAMSPVGVRQKVHHGKVYPVSPRPSGEKQQFSHIFHAEHYWPWPYVCQDRAHVTATWATQEANGWIEATTLFDFFFDEETDQLTVPGYNHLQWVIESVPETRRMVFVQKLTDPLRNQTRMNVVRMAAQEIAGDGAMPPIILRTARPHGRPAIEVQQIRTLEMSTLPPPRISSSGTGASGP